MPLVGTFSTPSSVSLAVGGVQIYSGYFSSIISRRNNQEFWFVSGMRGCERVSSVQLVTMSGKHIFKPDNLMFRCYRGRGYIYVLIPSSKVLSWIYNQMSAIVAWIQYLYKMNGRHN